MLKSSRNQSELRMQGNDTVGQFTNTGDYCYLFLSVTTIDERIDLA
jgi:hypothetical protein